MTRFIVLAALVGLAACNQAGLTPTEIIATETTTAIEQNPGSGTTPTTGTPDAATPN